MVIKQKLKMTPEILLELAFQFAIKPRIHNELIEKSEERQRIIDLNKIIDALANYLAWHGFAEQDYDLHHDRGEEALWRIRAINGMRMNDLRGMLKRKKSFYLYQMERAYPVIAQKIWQEQKNGPTGRKSSSVGWKYTHANKTIIRKMSGKELRQPSSL